jgi:hypothetical protein
LVSPSPSGSAAASAGSFGFSPKKVSQVSGMVSASVSVDWADAGVTNVPTARMAASRADAQEALRVMRIGLTSAGGEEARGAVFIGASTTAR